jgi:glycosyltransferase involved in cell wall biosynthesis
VLAELDIRRKAQDLLIETLSADKWKQRNWTLHLYGRGKDEQKLRELIAHHRLEGKIILEGFQKNVKQILEDTHLLVQCTRIDAMPLSVVEAMAMSRPCLVSATGEMPSWIVNGKNGWVCDALTIPQLDLTLEKCWNEQEQWEAMGKTAFAVFKQKYPLPYEEELFDRFKSIF